jgi:hypothetical protein
MSEKILTGIGKQKVELSIIRIIIDSQRIGNEGMQFLCSRNLSHVTHMNLSKTIDIKAITKSLDRECFTSPEPIGKD